jgi:apolipoprotein N-acyltransferase
LANALIAIGAVMGLAGVGFIAMYVQSAIIDRLGEPDQSLLYWYLPILFIGLGLASAGVSVLRSGLRRKRAGADPDRHAGRG